MATHVFFVAEVDQHQADTACPCGPVKTADRTWFHPATPLASDRCATCDCRIVWSRQLGMWLHDVTDGAPCDEAQPVR